VIARIHVAQGLRPARRHRLSSGPGSPKSWALSSDVVTFYELVPRHPSPIVVYALDAHSGQVVWRKSLGRPVRGSALPCGNISQLGITGTPVIDDVNAAVYLDAMVDGQDGSGPQHFVFGLAVDDGSVVPDFPVNVAQALKTQVWPSLRAYRISAERC
jgi:outer membrane protein assembly factor BamB